MAEEASIQINLDLLYQTELLMPLVPVIPLECKNSDSCILKAVKALRNDNMMVEFLGKLKRGYEEMSQINVAYAELGLEQDICDLIVYEAGLKRRDFL